MRNKEYKQFVKKTFDTVAGGYEHSAMRYFSESAVEVASGLNLNGTEHVLDVATGTGLVALTIAGDLPDGRVTGIDFSKGMLSQADKKKEEAGITNVSFTEMDMQAIDFPNNHFDVAVNSFCIFFVDDMATQLSHIAEKVKENGRVLTTTFSENSFSPLVDLFLERIGNYGVEIPELIWKRVASTDQCRSLFEQAGLKNVTSEQKKFGYYLKDASDWWNVIWNGGFRELVNRLSETDFTLFKEEHSAEIETLKTEHGIWLEINIIFTEGTV